MRGFPVDLPLTPLNAIVGPTRRGKSSVLESIELALTGEHQLGATKLKELAPAGGKLEVELRLQLAEGMEDTAVFRAGTRPPFRPLSSVPPHLLPATCPVNSFAYLLEKGRAITREEILRRFPPPAGLDLTLEHVTDPYVLELWATVLERAQPAEGDALDAVVAAGDIIRSDKSRAGTLVSSLERQRADAARATAEAPLRVYDIPALERELSDATRREGEASARLQAAQRVAQLQASVASLRDQLAQFQDPECSLEELQTRLESAQTALNHARNSPPDGELVDSLDELVNRQADAQAALNRAQRLLELAELAVEWELDACPLCSAEQFAPGACRDRAAWSVYDRTSVLDSAKAAVLAAREAGLAASTEWRQRVREAEQVVREWERAYVETQRYLARWAEVGQALAVAEERLRGAEDVSPAELRAAEARPAHIVQGELELARRLERGRDLARNLEEQYLAAVRLSEALSVLDAASAGVLNRAVLAVKDYVEQQANVLCPAGYRVELEVTDTRCGWRMLGADGEPHQAGVASGSESVMILLGAADAASVDCPVRVLNLDDAQLGPFRTDPQVLQLLLAQLQQAVSSGRYTMINVAGLREDEIPPGWNIIRR